MSTQITNVIHKDLSSELSEIYYVLWDCETQSELWRGTHSEAIAMDKKDSDCLEGGFGDFGGGAYCMYKCLQGYSIKEIIPRQEGRLQILLIEDKE